MWRILPLVLVFGCVGSGGGDDVRVVPNTDVDPAYEGVMELTPSEELVISGAVVGERINGVVQVANTGDFPLDLKRGELTDDGGGALVTDEATNADRTVQRGEFYEIIIVCTLPDEADVTGVLTVESGNRDEPIDELVVRCTTDD